MNNNQNPSLYFLYLHFSSYAARNYNTNTNTNNNNNALTISNVPVRKMAGGRVFL